MWRRQSTYWGHQKQNQQTESVSYLDYRFCMFTASSINIVLCYQLQTAEASSKRWVGYSSAVGCCASRPVWRWGPSAHALRFNFGQPTYNSSKLYLLSTHSAVCLLSQTLETHWCLRQNEACCAFMEPTTWNTFHYYHLYHLYHLHAGHTRQRKVEVAAYVFIWFSLTKTSFRPHYHSCYNYSL